jgi:magnesium transporter
VSEPAPEAEEKLPSSESSGDDFTLDPNLIGEVAEAIDQGNAERLRSLVAPLHIADIADLLQNLSSERRRAFVSATRETFQAEILAELNETVRDEIIEELGLPEIAAAVTELETDDAVLVVAELDEEEKRRVLEAIPAEDRTLIEAGLAYREFTAGRLMRRELVAVPTFWTVGDTIDYLRHAAELEEDALPEEFFDIFVVDPAHRPIGAVTLSRLLRSRRPVPLTEIMQTDLKVIRTDTDQEDVAFLFRQRDLASAPVVDEGGRLVGVITIDDVVDVIDEEHEDDIMRLGGVAQDDFYSATIDTARSRFTWLLVNLGTAILASLVIGMFEATIEQMVALAVLMPIVASMGGNAGTQTLTVAVRALATHELTPANATRVIGKELLVGVINGGLFAVITGAVTWLWFGSSGIATVIALAMIVNLIAAALFGAMIPLFLERAGIDPAVSSSVFLTTITDVVGFFAFLGLAAWVLL